ncbi:flagellar hook-length control protein FliK [Stutzerimonas decontaminans]|jgi:flagellar hook-length control protein FliK|uniref:Flagellar hook-length control protein FliK n=1 Tax=Stutzerimonas decontaminans TaxID=3022791 RepID=A0ABX4W5V5_9GAMM|nr:flagellar hook-length control protein FliK [Stutzerimonas decontaminans]MCQ4246283.1 flagellar hook-length control protein FliK [Stutzerimonas decontaminans]PNF86737.1 flagellar hook-length control protein FliK [Stutzerimonas decontaminans]
MAVSPDLLLKTPSVDARAKASAKAPDAPREGRDSGSASFSDVYAKERQSKPVERSARNDSGRDKPVDDKGRQEAAGVNADEKSAVAESGNALPADAASEELPETELDPLLLLGLGGQFVTQADAQPAGEPEGDSLLAGLPVAQSLTAGEGELVADEPAVTGLQTSAETLGVQKSTQQLQNPLADAQAKAEADDGFASVLLAGKDSADSDEPELELAVKDLLDSVEAPKESRSSSASELAAARLNPLSQAITQQVQQAQRPALVPGQPVQMQQSGWSEAVVNRVMWLSSQNLKSAEIQLDPAELGRMEVRIDLTKDQAQVTFLSPHAGVRDALEGQMQRLREMFTQQGMNLMDVNVSDQSLARGWQGGADGGASRGGSSADGEAGEGELQQGVSEISSNRSAGDRGLVDYYA